MNKLKKLSKEIFNLAVRSLIECGELTPTFLVIKGSGAQAFPCFFENDARKAASVHAIHAVCTKIDADGLILAAEAWMVHKNAETTDINNLEFMPRDDPEKFEVLQILYMNKFGEAGMIYGDISRDKEGNPHIEEMKEMDDFETMGGRMVQPWATPTTLH